MNKLLEIRAEINAIDKEMKELFLKRMEIVKGVAEYKIKNNLPVLDESREVSMIENLMNDVNPEMQEYYLEFLKNNIKISRDMQQKLIDENK